jgi:hypothetical protein
MTRIQFMSAISRLTVRPGPDGFVIGRPIYLSAAGAFNRAGAIGFARFIGRRGPVDTAKVRAEFVAWLEGVGEEEIGRFIAAMRDREQDDRDKALAFSNGPERRDSSSLRDQVAQANDKARGDRSAGGVKRKENRAGKDEALKSEIMSKLNTLRPKARSRRDAALRIQTALIGGAFELGCYRIYEILTDLENENKIEKFRSGYS